MNAWKDFFKTPPKQQVFSVLLVLLSVVCLIVGLWVLIVVVRFLLG